MTRSIEDILKDLHKVQDEIDAEYWHFTRCAQGQPPNHKLYVKRTELENELEEARSIIRPNNIY